MPPAPSVLGPSPPVSSCSGAGGWGGRGTWLGGPQGRGWGRQGERPGHRGSAGARTAQPRAELGGAGTGRGGPVPARGGCDRGSVSRQRLYPFEPGPPPSPVHPSNPPTMVSTRRGERRGRAGGQGIRQEPAEKLRSPQACPAPALMPREAKEGNKSFPGGQT